MQAEQLVKDSSNNNWCISKMSYKEVKQKQYLYKEKHKHASNMTNHWYN